MRIGDERVPVLAIYHSPGTTCFAFGNAKGRVVVINTDDWSIVRDFNAANGPIWSLVIMPDGQSIVVAGLDDFITRWELFEFPPEFLERPGPAGDSIQQPKSPMEKSSLLANAVFATLCHPTASVAPARPCSGCLAGWRERWRAIPIPRRCSTRHHLERGNHQPSVFRGAGYSHPGTKMPIQRMKNDQDRIDLVSYLKMATKETTVE